MIGILIRAITCATLFIGVVLIYMLARLGEDYEAYRRQVRRWLPTP